MSQLIAHGDPAGGPRITLSLSDDMRRDIGLLDVQATLRQRADPSSHSERRCRDILESPWHFRMKADPETFFVTEHYRGYPTVLVRLGRVRKDDLQAVLEEAWRRQAPKRLVKEYDQERAG